MKKIAVTFVYLLCLCLASRASGEIKQVPFTDVQVKDLFWKQRLDVMRNITIRYAFQKCTDAGQLRNFEYAGKIVSGEAQVGDLKFQSGNPYDDAEVYKVLEGASYVLTTQKDESLEAYCDGVVDLRRTSPSITRCTPGITVRSGRATGTSRTRHSTWRSWWRQALPTIWLRARTSC